MVIAVERGVSIFIAIVTLLTKKFNNKVQEVEKRRLAGEQLLREHNARMRCMYEQEQQLLKDVNTKCSKLYELGIIRKEG